MQLFYEKVAFSIFFMAGKSPISCGLIEQYTGLYLTYSLSLMAVFHIVFIVTSEVSHHLYNANTISLA